MFLIIVEPESHVIGWTEFLDQCKIVAGPLINYMHITVLCYSNVSIS